METNKEMAKQDKMQWEVKKIKEGVDKGKWGIYLIQKYCKTDELVCYGASRSKKEAQLSVKRMNHQDDYTE